MNPASKIAICAFSLPAFVFLLTPHCAPAQQVQPAQPPGGAADSGIYSWTQNRLSMPGVLGPAGSYGGAFGIPGQQNGAGSLNAAGLNSKKAAASALTRSGWAAGTTNFSERGTAVWTGGADAFGTSRSSSWTAGKSSFEIPVQAGGIWRAPQAFSPPLGSSASIQRSAALTTGTILPISSPGSGSMSAASSHRYGRGSAANGVQAFQPLSGFRGGLGSPLSSGISDPFGGLHRGVRASRPSGSQGRRETGTIGNQGASSLQQHYSGALADPFSNNTLDSTSGLDGGSGLGPNGGTLQDSDGTQP